MPNIVRSIVASVLLLALATLTAGVVAGTSLALGWLENHPVATDYLAWGLGAVGIVVGFYLVARLWLLIYRMLGSYE